MKRLLTIIILLCSSIITIAQKDLCPEMHKKIVAEQYIVDYSDEFKIPKLVYYLVYSNITESYPRSAWHKELYSGAADPWDYTYSGYDRGHMFPFNSSRTKRSGYESFDMVNVCPQTVSLNRGIWSTIESFEQRNCNPYAYVITGPVMIRGQPYIKNKILIPYQFFKIIYYPNINQMIGFICRQTDSGYLDDFVVTVDVIELITGIDFFSQLPIHKQKKLESKVDLSKWN